MKRVLVIGLAETGIAVARRLRAEGCEVVVIDDVAVATDRRRARVDELERVGAEFVPTPDAAATRRLVAGVDLVVPSPLVRPDHLAIEAARTADIPVRSEIDLAGERASAPIVAVTGTNGKTTVTTMIAAMLDASGVGAVAAGNIGRPLIEAIGDDVDVFVAEVSSFQLEFAETFHPAVAVLLAITPDHLDWHGSFERYVAAKARITEHQAASDVFVYDADDANARAVAASARARTVCITTTARDECMHVAQECLTFPDGRELIPLAALSRSLLHDRTNALASASAALAVGATEEGVRASLATYSTMPHRVALVGEAYGVRWYDDSKATNPDATLRAVSSFDSVVLIAGGRNKGLDLSVLASRADRLRGVVAIGEARDEIVTAFATVPSTDVVTAASMHDAVDAARALARSGDVVLLSPACASFDAYDGYAQRGDDFAAEVQALIAEETTS
jgi:UDP-N-acetylmuramoylalanine--D-glutamate ligase